MNNAGYGLNGDTESSLPSAPEEHAKARLLLETNFWGVANLTLHAMRVMREVNPLSGQRGGVVLQITSMGGFVGYPGSAYYHAAKFAVEGFTESVSKEVRPEWNSKLRTHPLLFRTAGDFPRHIVRGRRASSHETSSWTGRANETGDSTLHHR